MTFLQHDENICMLEIISKKEEEHMNWLTISSIETSYRRLLLLMQLAVKPSVSQYDPADQL